MIRVFLSLFFLSSFTSGLLILLVFSKNHLLLLLNRGYFFLLLWFLVLFSLFPFFSLYLDFISCSSSSPCTKFLIWMFRKLILWLCFLICTLKTRNSPWVIFLVMSHKVWYVVFLVTPRPKYFMISVVIFFFTHMLFWNVRFNFQT